jgi:hypothetical protein
MLAIHAKRFTNNPLVSAKVLAPQAVGHDNHMIFARLALFRHHGALPSLPHLDDPAGLVPLEMNVGLTREGRGKRQCRGRIGHDARQALGRFPADGHLIAPADPNFGRSRPFDGSLGDEDRVEHAGRFRLHQEIYALRAGSDVGADELEKAGGNHDNESLH